MLLPNIPQAPNIIAQSQPQLLENNRVLGTLIGPNDGTIEFMPQLYNEAVTAGSVGVYSAIMPNPAPQGGVGSNVVELYVHNSANAAFPITANQNVLDAPSGYSTGWSYISSGLILKWGWARVSAPNAPNVPIQIALAQGPVYVQIVSLQITSSINAVIRGIDGPGANTISITGDTLNGYIQYTVLGY